MSRNFACVPAEEGENKKSLTMFWGCAVQALGTTGVGGNVLPGILVSCGVLADFLILRPLAPPNFYLLFSATNRSAHNMFY